MSAHADQNILLSPALSASSFVSSSWQQKSPSELVPILQTAYDTLKVQENALKMAAHVGQSLLENNIALKSSYEQLLQSAPYPTPTQSTSLLDQHDEEDWIEYIEPARTREALVEILEQQNTDLQSQLEKVLSNQEDLDRAHQKKSKQLQGNVDHLQQCLERATKTIQEMEEIRKPKKTLTRDSSLLTANLPTDTCCAETKEKMKQLRSDYDHLSQSKAQIEKTLYETINRNSALQQQYESTTQDHESLQRAFDEQSSQVNELQTDLEEYRIQLGRLRDQGVGSSVYASSVTSSELSSSLYTDTYELDNRRNTSLLTELNMATSKSQSLLYGDTDYFGFQNFSQSNVDSTVESILLKADKVDSNQSLDEVLSFVGMLETEYNHTRFLQQKRHLCYKKEFQDAGIDAIETTQVVRYPSLERYNIATTETPKDIQNARPDVYRSLLSLIDSLLQFIRFSLIMFLAAFFSLRKGPESFNNTS